MQLLLASRTVVEAMTIAIFTLIIGDRIPHCLARRIAPNKFHFISFHYFGDVVPVLLTIGHDGRSFLQGWQGRSSNKDSRSLLSASCYPPSYQVLHVDVTAGSTAAAKN